LQTRIGLKTNAPDVADHAHNLNPWRLISDDCELNSLAQRIFIAEHSARELFVNDGDRRLIWL